MPTLANSTEYYLIWDAGVVKDLANNPIAAQASTTLWSFTTAAGADVTAPTVSSFSPVDNATGVSVTTNLVATISETVTLGTGIVSLKRTSDNAVIQTWNVATQAGSGAGQVEVVSSTQLTMHLTGSLANSIEHYVIWDANVVKDAANNPIAANAVTTLWSFTTAAGADVTPPTVSSFSPVDNATGVAITTNLVATMSETVTLGASGVITLKRTSDNATIDSWNVATAGGSTAGKVEVVGGTALTMHLTTSLANSIEYYVIWDAGVVKDAASNPIAVQSSTTLWSFTTVAGGSTLLIDALGVSAIRAYSTRKLRSAYAGSAIRIRRSSDNAEQDIGFISEDLDTAAITTFVGANSAFVVKMYDQSGSADDQVQVTVANQPRIVNAGTLEVRNTKAAPFYDGPNYFLKGGTASSVKTVGAVMALSDAGPNTTTYATALSQLTTAAVLSTVSGGSTWQALSVGAPSVNNGGNALVFGSVLFNTRASSATGLASTEALEIGAFQSGTNYRWRGWIGEEVLFDPQLSAPNYATLYTNQKTYWGTP